MMTDLELLSESWKLESGEQSMQGFKLRNNGLKSARTLILSTVVVSIGSRKGGRQRSLRPKKRAIISLSPPDREGSWGGVSQS